jgi:histidine triad (HIT) family protein
MVLFSQRVARAIEAEVPCQRIGICVLGLEVPHAHVHLVPLITKSVIDFSEKLSMSQEELASLAAAISARFE